MDNEFDKQASKILREIVGDISAERYGDEWDLDGLDDDLKTDIELFINNLEDMESASTIDLQDIVNGIDTSSKYSHADKEKAIGYLEHIAKHLDKDDLYGPEGIFSDIDKDFYDEQRDQDPFRHEGLEDDFDAEQRDQDPFRHTPGR